MAERYNFKYLPLVGKLPGKSMVEQTETAINELASVVYDNVGHVGNLAEEVQTANTNASNALDKATEALETSSRVYIKQIAAVDVNDYYDSELYYIDNDGSTNIPVRDRGFLEVKTNDDKTACEQVFIADSTGTPYYRHGRITEQTLGEETTYVVTWSSWYGEQQADWNVTDTTNQAFIKNKPLNLKNIGNENAINMYSFFKDDNNGNPVYMLMQELTSYSPDSNTLPAPAPAGFNGIVYGKLRTGNGFNQLVALITVNLGYEYNFLYSSSDHYRPVVVKDEASNKYYWAMMAYGSHQDVIMFGQFTKAPLFTKIMATDKQGTLPSGWSLIHDAKTYELPRTIVAKAVSDRNGARIDTTYLKKADAQQSIKTNTLTATDATFTGQTTVPTANAGNSSKAIANTEYVQGELTNYLPLSGGTMSGAIHFNGANNRSFGFDLTDNNTNMDIGWNWENRDGAGFGLRSTDDTGGTPGSFSIYARDGSNSTSLNGYPDGRLTWDGQPLLPVGVVQAFAGRTTPQGWLLCDGSAVSRTDYAALFAVIGTTYGAGNGSTTFNLPNLVDKFVEGSATAGTVKSAGLPNITGGVKKNGNVGGLFESQSGALYLTNITSMQPFAIQGNYFDMSHEVNFDASRSSSIYGGSTTVQPPALTMRYIIKY